jgi:lipopolysaccharide biosynthesis glycosyltransferase
MRLFADAHGYSFRALERESCCRRGGWIKIEPILALLAEGFDYVLWLDADTIVARTDIDIRNVTQQSAHLHMAWHKPLPRPGGDPAHFNTGVMLIRASDWSRKFFAQVWDVGPREHRWNDQATILHLLGFDGALGTGKNRENAMSHPVGWLNITWNSIPQVCALEDPVVWHFAGMEMGVRLDAMRRVSGSVAA